MPTLISVETALECITKHARFLDKMGIKGIGELGITSVAVSIANAIFKATGKRMRDFLDDARKVGDGSS